MRITVFLFLILSAEHLAGEQSHISGFEVGKTYLYHVHGESAGNNLMEYALQISVLEHNKLVFQPRYFQLFKNHGTPKETQIPSEVLKCLETPTEVTLDQSGQLMSMKVPQDLPEWALCLKRSQVTYFVLNTGSTNDEGGSTEDTQRYYSVQEDTDLGQCDTAYSVREVYLTRLKKKRSFHAYHPELDNIPFFADYTDDSVYGPDLPGVQGQSEEFQWIPAGEEDPNQVAHLPRFCNSGSKVYTIVKNTDLQYCRNPDESNVVIRGHTKGESSTQFTVCGLNRKNLTVLEISHQLVLSQNHQFQNFVLFGISNLDRSKVQSVSEPSQEISDFTNYSPEMGFDMIEIEISHYDDTPKQKGSSKSVSEQWHEILDFTNYSTEFGFDLIEISHFNTDKQKMNSNDAYRIKAFRSCLEETGNGHEFLSRDLNSEAYNHVNNQWNFRTGMAYPLAYFLPNSAQDVARAVRCGLDIGVHLVPNGGGHSYESISWGTNDTIVVDFRNMTNVAIEGSGTAAVARLEPGALVGPIHAYLWENGGYATTLGACLTVGIGGHAIGGGFGYLSTKYGLVLDNVLEFEVVDGRGKVVVANEDQNEDLFWALRGAGPGYIGIVTGLKLRLMDADRFNITLLSLRYTVDQFAPFFIAYQNLIQWARDNEPPLSLNFFVAGASYNSTFPPILPGITFNAVYIQDPIDKSERSDEIVKAILKILPPPTRFHRASPSYLQFLTLTSYGPAFPPNSTVRPTDVTVSNYVEPVPLIDPRGLTPMTLPADPELLAYLKSFRKEDAAPRYFKAKSFFINSYFTLQQMQSVGAMIAQMPPNFWIICNNANGRIHETRRNDTAYVHRDSLLDIILHYEGSPDHDQVAVGIKYLYDLVDTMQFMDGGETYQNQPDLDLEHPFTRYYGNNLERLIRLKTEWDPFNFFQTPLSLPGRSRGWK